MNRLTTKGKIVFGILSIFIIALITITLIFIFTPKDKDPKELNSKYKEEVIEIMKEKNLYNKINEKEYSKTIEIMLEQNEFKEKYLEDYYKIEYINDNSFPKNTNNLLDKNYTPAEINYINNNLKEDINILLNMKHIDILKFKDITNFDIKKLERYLDYSKENTNYKLREEAASAFKKLTEAGIKDNVIFYPFSAYRSYNTQNGLYTNYKNRDGEKEADTYSARPGFSEHQLGLAVDVRSSNLTSNLTTEDYKWMLDNSYKYGFIIRYPKGKQHITQFIEEPWHIRYLGVELATKVHDSGLTYDEYYDLYIEKR